MIGGVAYLEEVYLWGLQLALNSPLSPGLHFLAAIVGNSFTPPKPPPDKDGWFF
ncbi:hypothetical protein I79_001221 [Cricetulus griseus]|uniref:Uncharacterized protein n=1 Tax=Cricetulus griseus TaxID=10029 RepID=G3GU70_CRIGR|nr:hypothetical protein I79_001221 [Cricetulus griseus]